VPKQIKDGYLRCYQPSNPKNDPNLHSPNIRPQTSLRLLQMQKKPFLSLLKGDLELLYFQAVVLYIGAQFFYIGS
jgi:hypothetical protein